MATAADILREAQLRETSTTAKRADISGPRKVQRFAPIKRVDEERRIVTAEVYAPFVLDTYGEYMTPDDIETMCHRFAQLDLKNVIDTNHDNVPNGSVVLESYIVRGEDPDFTTGSWVLSVYVADDMIWDKVKRGELNGYSFEAMCRPVKTICNVSVIRDHVGVTKSAEEDIGSDHSHAYFVQMNAVGRVTRGVTSAAPDGHTHEIKRASFTEPGGADGHTHRYDLF